MVIMASTLAAAINECRHVAPEELKRDNIKIADPVVNRFEIEFINSCGHIIYNYIIENVTERYAIQTAKKNKKELYPDCAWIEIINLVTHKRIYA